MIGTSECSSVDKHMGLTKSCHPFFLILTTFSWSWGSSHTPQAAPHVPHAPTQFWGLANDAPLIERMFSPDLPWGLLETPSLEPPVSHPPRIPRQPHEPCVSVSSSTWALCLSVLIHTVGSTTGPASKDCCENDPCVSVSSSIEWAAQQDLPQRVAVRMSPVSQCPHP